MTKFQVSIVINKPVHIIVKALMDPDNFPYWQTDLERFEVIEGKPGINAIKLRKVDFDYLPVRQAGAQSDSHPERSRRVFWPEFHFKSTLT